MLAFLTFLACTGTSHEGTIVGNPGDAKGKLASSSDVEFYSAWGDIQSMELIQGGNSVPIDFIADIDLLDLTHTFSIPAGHWDSLYVSFLDIGIEGIDLTDGRSFIIALQNFENNMNGVSFDISEEEYVFEIASPDWLRSEFLNLIAGEDIYIDSETIYYEDVLEPVQQQTMLFVDTDGDGDVSEKEREEDKVAYTVESAEELGHEEANNEEDTGEAGSKSISTCGGKETTMSLIFLPFLFFGTLVRRED
jgi:hypothetical protein